MNQNTKSNIMINTRKNRRLRLLATCIGVGMIIFIMLMLSTPVQAHAASTAPNQGFSQAQGRTDTANENDFHTAAWERFHNNYQFTSGADHRHSLGRPTTFNGFVPVDVHTANIRRDANVSLRPPRYGVFSGHIPTEPSNLLFPQPVNPAFNHTSPQASTSLNPRFDITGHGVNPQPVGNPMNIQNSPPSGFLPPTSIGR